MIYLDNAATTRISPLVLETMMPFLTDEYGNAGAIYSFGVSARQAVEKARAQVAEMIGADSPEQIVFTSGGTESNNWVFYNTGIRKKDRSDIVTSKTEHDSVIESARYLEGRLGFDVYYTGVDKWGCVNLHELERSLNNNVALASIMYVNNETGSVNDVEKIGEMCRAAKIPYHCDAVQAPGSVDIDVKRIGCDYLSLSSHKLHGPKGVGALFIRDKKTIRNMIHGGVSQEFGLRGGTENVAGIVGFGKACELVTDGPRKGLSAYKDLKKAFHSRLLATLMGSTGGKRIQIKVNADSLDSDGRILNLMFRGVDAESLVLIAGTKGLCISAGSACRSRNQEPSHVLRAIGLADDEARESIRVSFSDFTTLKEAREGGQILAKSLLTYTQI